MDIAGAFDNLWWPSITQAMINKKIPQPFILIISSFLVDRVVQYNSNNANTSKSLSKGCPQGSVLDPFLWNIVLDGLISAIALQSDRLCGWRSDKYLQVF